MTRQEHAHNSTRTGRDSDGGVLQGEQEKGAVNPEAREQLLDAFRVGRGAHDDLRATESLQCLGLVDLRAVDVLVRAELTGECFLRRSRGESNDAVTHGPGELDTEMTETAAYEGQVSGWSDIGQLGGMRG